MSGSKNLTIVQMNDSHAYFDLHQEMFWQGDHAVYRPAGGYARIATIVKQIRAESQGRILFLRLRRYHARHLSCPGHTGTGFDPYLEFIGA